MRRLPDDKFRGKKNTPKTNTHRLFLAIFPPEEYISYFKEVLKYFDKQKRNLKNLPVDQIHVTLRFIGAAVTDSSKDLIFEQLQKHSGNYPHPEMSIDKIQFGFKHQYDPRVLMATVKEENNLSQLAEIVYQEIKVLRLRDTIRWKEKRGDDFHITLSRLKPSATRSSGKEITKLVPTVDFLIPETFTAEYMDFVESNITPQGPVYKRLGRIKL